MGKLPAFEDWKWPWTPGEIDEDKAAHMIWKLKQGFEKQQEEISGKDQEIADLTTQLADAQAAQTGGDDEAQQTIKDLRKEVADLQKAGTTARPEDQKKIWQLEAALELGLSASDAKRLVGDTEDEVKADAKVFARDHGYDVDEDNPGSDSEDEENFDYGAPPPRQEPRQFRTGTPGQRLTTTPSNPEAAKKLLPKLSF